MRRLLAAGSCLALYCLAPQAVLAQEGPAFSSTNPAQALPRDREPAAPLAGPARNAAPASADATGLRFTLKTVTFKGAKALSPARLESIWAPYRGREVTLADLKKIAAATEAAYDRAGFPFVAVVVPPQTVLDGQVELQVVEAHISDLTVLGLDPVARRQVAGAFQPLVGRTPLPARAVQRAYNNAQAVPGLSVAGALRPGSEPGGMDLVVQARRREWRGYVNVNNYYSDPVGPWGLLAGADYYGASRFGDRSTVQLYSTLDRNEQQVVRLAHYRGLDADGTSLSADVLVARAHPRGLLSPLQIATDVTTAHFELDRPLFTGPGLTVQGALGLEGTDQKTRIFTNVALTEDRLRIGVARLSGTWNRPGLGGLVTVEVRQGLSFAGASRRGDPQLSRADADPRALVFRASSQTDIALPAHMSATLSVQGQTSRRSLAAPEEFSVGNLTIGRGYDPGAAYGDQALGYSAEIRLRAFAVRPELTIQPFAFSDGVEVWNKEAGAPSRRYLSSAGLGFHVALLGRAQLDLTYAVPAAPPLGFGEPKPQPKLLVNFTVGIPDAFRGLGRAMSRGGTSMSSPPRLPSPSRGRPRRLLLAACGAMALMSGSAHALPAGGVVTASTSPGSASINTLATSVTVTQTATRVFLDWSSFNIASNETVTFTQPSASAIAFNRIPVGQPVTIAGALNANGSVWLFSPGGVLFSSTAVVNTGSFVASLATRPNGSETAVLTGNTINNPTAGAASATITVSPGARLTSNAGFTGFFGRTINQNGTVSASEAVAYMLADTGGFVITPTPSGVQFSSAILNSTGLRTFNHAGSTTGRIVTITASPNSFQSIINMTGVIQATGFAPAQQGSTFGPTSVFIIAGNGSTADSVINTGAGRISGPGGVQIVGGSVTVGQVNAGQLGVLTPGDLTTAGAITTSGSVDLHSAQGDLTVGAPITASGYMDVTAGGNLAVNANLTTTEGGQFAQGGMSIYAAGNIRFADNVAVRGSGYVDVTAGDTDFDVSSPTATLIVGPGATLSGADGLGLQTSGKLTIGAGATVSSLYSKNVIKSARWPFIAVNDDLDPTTDGGLDITASDIDLQGSLFSYSENGQGRGFLAISTLGTSATIGGGGETSGFSLSNAEFQRIHGGLVVIVGDSFNDQRSSGLNSVMTIKDLTLDFANLDSLWLGSLIGQSMSVPGILQGAGSGKVDLRLGFIASGYDDDDLPRAIFAVPSRLEITGSLGTFDHPLGQVGLLSTGDILMGSASFIEAARASGFDPHAGTTYSGLEPGHLFVSASGLQMGAPGRIYQQNSGTTRAPNGLLIGAPTADRPLILAPDVVALLHGEGVNNPDFTVTDFRSGPTAIDIYGAYTDPGPGSNSARTPARNEFLLTPTLTTKPEYQFNRCAFGGGVCSGQDVIPLFQPAITTLVATIASSGSSDTGSVASDSGPGNAIVRLSAITTDMVDDEDEKKQGVATPVTGSGNGDLWIPLESVQ